MMAKRRRPTKNEVMAQAILDIMRALDRAYRHPTVHEEHISAILGAVYELRRDGAGLRLTNTGG